MTVKYFVDEDGKYLGAFDGAEPPEGSSEVSTPPSDGRQIWDGLSWTPAPNDHYPLEAIISSPNGSYFKVTIDDDGVTSVQNIT